MSEDTGTGFKPKVGTIVFLIVFIVSFIAMVNMINTQTGVNATEYGNLEGSVEGIQSVYIPSPPTGLDALNPLAWIAWFYFLAVASFVQFLLAITWFTGFIVSLIAGTGVFAEIPDPVGIIIRVPILLVIGFTAFYILMVIVSYIMKLMGAMGSAAGGVVPG